jgi:hypothetical protein
MRDTDIYRRFSYLVLLSRVCDEGQALADKARDVRSPMIRPLSVCLYKSTSMMAKKKKKDDQFKCMHCSLFEVYKYHLYTLELNGQKEVFLILRVNMRWAVTPTIIQ